MHKNIRNSKDIAIVGISCRFPGANNYFEFWNNLKEGKSSIREIPKDRWDVNEYYSTNISEQNKGYCKWAGLLDVYNLFDYQYFSISPREANEMDPHQRILLEETTRCIEDSAISLKELREKKTSVFVGLTELDYYLEAADPKVIVERFATTGVFPSIAANRISYNFGFSGQSMTLDTACASSLTSVHEGKKALLSGECDYAVIGSACVISHPWKLISFAKARALSFDGRCKTFDKDANGFVPGEGAAVLIMQRFEDAVKNKNKIYGILKGTAVNHGGKSISLPSPRVGAQRSVLLDAYEDANINPETISYIEAHGTGTSLGDPIEIEALTAAFRKYTAQKQFCKIGSVKTNIGHLGPAAGMASIFKVLLMFQNRKFVRSLNFNQPNPIIDFENSPFSVTEQYEDWKSKGACRAGISSFGIGGANAHIVLESWSPKKQNTDVRDGGKLFVLSAKSVSSLDKVLARYKDYASKGILPLDNLDNLCKTLQLGREDHKVRYGKIVHRKEELRDLLINKNNQPDFVINNLKDWLLVIDGPEISYLPSYKKLETDLPFKHHFDTIKNILTEIDPEKYRSFCLEDISQNQELLSFITGYIFLHAVVDLGFAPAGILNTKNHLFLSLAFAEIISVKNSIKLLLKIAKPAEIKLSRPSISFFDQVNEEFIRPFVFDREYLDTLIHGINIKGEHFDYYLKKAKTLFEVQFSFKKYVEEWDKKLAKYSLSFGQLLDEKSKDNYEQDIKSSLLLIIIIISSIRQLYLKWNLKEDGPIQDKNFIELVNLMLDDVLMKEYLIDLMLNENPGYPDILKSLNSRQDKVNIGGNYSFIKNKNKALTEIKNFESWISGVPKKIRFQTTGVSYSSLVFGKKVTNDGALLIPGIDNPLENLKETALDLWLNNVDIGWEKLDSCEYYKLPLPAYEFDGKKCWREKVADNDRSAYPSKSEGLHPLIDKNNSTLLEQKFSKLFLGTEFYFTDHVIHNNKVFPGAAYLELARASGEIAGESHVVKIQDVIFLKPLLVKGLTQQTQISLLPNHEKVDFNIHSVGDAGENETYCTGKIVLSGTGTGQNKIDPVDTKSILSRCKIGRPISNYYEQFEKTGIHYGTKFQVIDSIFVYRDEAFSSLKLKEKNTEDDNFILHPSLIDAAFQTVAIASGAAELYIPFSLAEIEIFEKCNQDCHVYARIEARNREYIKAFLLIVDDEGNVKARLKDLIMKYAESRNEESLVYYINEWLKVDAVTPGANVTDEKVFVFGAGSKSGISNLLRHRNKKNVPVKYGSGFAKNEDDSYIINPEKEEDIEKLFHQFDPSSLPRHFIFDWSDLNYGEPVNEQLNRTFFLVYTIGKKIAKYSNREKFYWLNVCQTGTTSLNPYISALVGFAKSLRQEIPHLLVKTIQINDRSSEEEKINILFGELTGDFSFSDIKYDKDSGKQIKILKQYQPGNTNVNPLRSSGVYVITGGMGGLGLIVAKFLLEKYNAKLVLAGRSKLTREKKDEIKKLISATGQIEFIQADVANEADVDRLIKETLEKFGEIHGIFHAAGVINDSLLLNKDIDQINQVLAPKIYGTVNLDRATRDLNVDFIALFSSITSVLGNIGQTDYAYANSFMDNYAGYKQGIWGQEGESRRFVSINWPLWHEGGMQVDEKTRNWMFQNQGTSPLHTKNGLAALESCLCSGLSQVVVLQGNASKINAVISRLYPEKISRDVEHGNEDNKMLPEDKNSLKIAIGDYLKEILAKETQLSKDEIQENVELDNYGIDSVMIVDLTRRLEEKFGELSKTLFFEYQTIEELAAYFMENFPGKLASVFSPEAKSQPKALPLVEKAQQEYSIKEETRFLKPTGQANSIQDIAIIGMSGKFPQAGDVNEFWENLINGRDCIIEIPKSRWDNDKYYNPDKSAPGAIYTKWGGFMDDIDQFDPLFFNIAPKEAELIDPQERLFLQTVYHAIENAGYSKDALKNDIVGVFAGAMWSEYQLYGVEETLKGNIMAPTSQIASIANRVSYFFNFQGPSIGLDTMCSSSISAIYLACQELSKGNIDYAVAGGVNVSVHPGKYIFLSQAKFASSDGRCRSFGQGGDGYVPGEGVGAVILKPLDKARHDGDHIYAVIKGWSINHGGKTNGYTVPNPNAQADLIKQALMASKIDPSTINYIETHGTGTNLGDPIEITGLTKAFTEFTNQKQYCSIGSVKSNIGHLESAAGIAAVIKVLLQFQHKKLVPSIHSDVLNPNIDFLNTPFYVQGKHEDWEQLTVSTTGTQTKLPRRAAVSAFGAGGSNGHLILEEFNNTNGSVDTGPGLFLLSAHNEPALKRYAAAMLKYFEKRTSETDLSTLNLPDICYTTQVGRESLPVRLAFVVDTLNDLIEKLKLFIGNSPSIQLYYYRNLKKDKPQQTTNIGPSDYNIGQLEREDLSILAKLWVKGNSISWKEFYAQSQGRKRTPLPGYPFSPEKYWIPKSNKKLVLVDKNISDNKLHPLIHSNESTLYEQVFKSEFNGNEFYFREHLVKGKKVLPGAAYLEMAVVSARKSSGAEVSGVTNISWEQTLMPEEGGQTVYTKIIPNGDDINFEIFSIDGNSKKIYSRGNVRLSRRERVPGEVQYENIQVIRERCTGERSGEEFYQQYHQLGIEYGQSFQCVSSLCFNEKESLSYLTLPEVQKGHYHQYFLHPSVLDGTIQTVLSFHSDPVLYLPYSIGELEIVRPLAQGPFYVHTRSTTPDGNSSDRSFDISVLSEGGEVLLRIKQLCLKASYQQAKKDDPELTCFKQDWRINPIKANNIDGQQLHGTTLIFLKEKEFLPDLRAKMEEKFTGCLFVAAGTGFQKSNGTSFEIRFDVQDDYLALFKELEAKNSFPGTIIHLASVNNLPFEESAPDENLVYGVYSLFNIAKSLISLNNDQRIHLLYVHNDGQNPLNSGILGYLKSLRKEASKIKAKSLQVNSLKNNSFEHLPGLLFKELQDFDRPLEIVKYSTEQERYTYEINELQLADSKEMPLKNNGVYLISGGAGALGIIFASHLAKKYNARLILTGRRELNPDIERNIEVLNDYPGEVEYRSVDITSETDVQNLFDGIREKYKGLNGIIHSAGLIKDALISHKTIEEFKQVVSPKVHGTVLLDKYSRDFKLDFFALFSSITGVMGNVGQCDYAFGNSFMDFFARWRQDEQKKGHRHGATISINWPLWKDGGMQVDAGFQQYIKSSMGMVPLGPEDGIKTFEQILSGNYCQVIVAKGIKSKIENTLAVHTGAVSSENQANQGSAGQMDSYSFAEKLHDTITDFIVQILKVKKDQIDVYTDISDYGFESITFTELATKINDRLNIDITPAIFFEYPTIKQLAEHLEGEYHEALKTIFTTKEKQVKADNHQSGPVAKPVHDIVSPVLMTKPTLLNKKEEFEDDIAIIGIEGVMPQSGNLEEFWQHLKNGDDLIGEIPPERWDWKAVYGDPVKERNKTRAKWGGFIHDIDKFDNSFFGISPREAELMDPQQRLFIQIVWKTIEDAGYKMSDLAGTNTGVFVGVASTSYVELLREKGVDIEAYTSTGNSHSIIANRVSYMFDFHGPSEPIDTACSSSLVAIHRGVEAIKQGKCGLAIAGGINVLIDPMLYISFDKAGMLSKNGRCKTFDKDADGYVRGEGAGAVLLKPLSKAKNDGDNIYAVIKATSENHGGRSASLTAPNPNAQADLIISAYKNARIDPATITYIEAHGTGTSLGDPIEINGLKKAFKELSNHFDSGDNKAYCGIGSVKSNIGHLETAAGIAGLLKSVLAIKNGVIPPTIHFNEINPYIDLENSPFYICKEARDWKRLHDKNMYTIPRRAGISSFGFGGANAHVVIEEYTGVAGLSTLVDEPRIIVLSAKNEERLKQYARDLATYIKNKHNSSPVQDNLQQVELALKEIAGELLYVGTESVDGEEDWDGLGFDAVRSVAYIEKIQELYGIKLPNDILNDYKTICSLGDYICKNFSLKDIPIHKTAPSEPGINLRDLAYTLQTGREAMEERAAFIASNVMDLVTMLDEFSEDPSKLARGFFHDRIKKKKGPSVIQPGDEDRDFLESLVRNRKFEKIASLWTSGFDFDWSGLYKQSRPGKISLPTYPFSKNRFWIPDNINMQDAARSIHLHPLLHRNASDLYSQKFISEFTGQEFYLDEHVVKNQKILPGAAYIEAAGRAGELSSLKSVSEIRNIHWKEPIKVGKDTVKGQLSLFPVSNERIQFEVGTLTSSGLRINATGEIITSGKGLAGLSREVKPYDNIESIKERCGHIFNEQEIYDFFDTTGLDYGVSFRLLKQIRANKKESIARIELAVNRETDFPDYRFHPCIIDGAFQSVSGILRVNNDALLYVPYTLDNVQLVAPLQTKCYAYACLDTNHTGTYEKKFDIGITDGQGRLLVRIEGLVVKAIQQEIPGITGPDTKNELSMAGKEQKNEAMDYRKIVTNEILNIIGDILKINPGLLDTEADLGDLGFDSISFTSFTNVLNEKFKLELTPAIFFEYSTANSFIGHLLLDYQENILQRLKINKTTQDKIDSDIEKTVPGQRGPARSLRLATGKGALPTTIDDPVAVVGIACKMPLSDDVDEFWENICAGKDLITEIPSDRWAWQDFMGDPAREANKTNVKWGGFIRRIDTFDNQFFAISPREAELMDPQQRIFMETVWKAIEDSGYKTSALAGSKTGLFVGVSTSDYSRILRDHGVDVQAYTTTGMSQSILANRISYLFDFHGPSEAIDTACSSSLVALNRAIESIQNGSSELAIVGGVNIIIDPMIYISFSKAGMLSKDGKCKTFDKNANGYVRGEGAGAIVLKPLSKAKLDGDNIYAVIKSVSENHGGHANSLTAPNVKAQASLIVDAFQKAQIDPESVSYIEAHGTGTNLGDPVEVNALKNAFKELYQRKGNKFEGEPFCGLGSVKTNIGHLESAAGIAGLLKLTLALYHKKIPASINFKELNPYIDLKGHPFYIVTKTKQWENAVDNSNKELPRRAGISSFGFGGTNAHAVLEEYVEGSPRPGISQELVPVFILSAKSKVQLEKYIDKYIEYLQKTGNNLDDIVYTLQTGREPMEERLAVVARDIAVLKEKLWAYRKGEKNVENLHAGNTKEFKNTTGQILEGEEGNQYMGQLKNNRKWDKIAQLWVTGTDFEWEMFYKHTGNKRVPIPTYPFNETSHWVPKQNGFNLNTQIVHSATKLHPYVEMNESTFSEQKFSTTLHGALKIISDHVIYNRHIVPGVAYLEMMRYAAGLSGKSTAFCIRNIRWEQPLIVNDREKVYIQLYPSGNKVECEIYTHKNDTENIHCQGEVVLQDYRLNGSKAGPEHPLNIESIKSRLQNQLNQDDFYARFKELGMNYGNSFRLVSKLYYQENSALAHILDPGSGDISGLIKLQPGILDSALQGILGTMLMQGTSTLFLPYAIEELTIFGSLPGECFAWIEKSDVFYDGRFPQFTVKITGNDGKLLVAMKNIVLKPIQHKEKKIPFNDLHSDEGMLDLLRQLENGILKAEEVNQIIDNL